MCMTSTHLGCIRHYMWVGDMKEQMIFQLQQLLLCDKIERCMNKTKIILPLLRNNDAAILFHQCFFPGGKTYLEEEGRELIPVHDNQCFL